jgi:transposase-like protein
MSTYAAEKSRGYHHPGERTDQSASGRHLVARLVGVDELAQELGISRHTVYSWVSQSAASRSSKLAGCCASTFVGSKRGSASRLMA